MPLGAEPLGTEPLGASAGQSIWVLDAATGAFELKGRGAQAGRIGGYLTGRPNWLSIQDFLGAAAAADIAFYAKISIGTDPTATIPNLRTLSGAALLAAVAKIQWGPWQKYVPGQYQGRFVNWQIVIEAPNPNIQAIIDGFSAQCSVEDRVDHYLAQSVPAGGLAITFTPDGASAAAPFNRGPNNSGLPLVQVSNLQAGDTPVIGALSRAGCSVQIFNGGVAVARTNVNIIAEGF